MAETINTQTVVDINLDLQVKRQFRINGDDNLILELNPGDMGIIPRYEEVIPKFDKLTDMMVEIEFQEEPSADDPAINKFNEADNEARELVNYLFDYDVCSVCANGGSMFDMCNGKFRFEELIEQLFKLYDDTITEEHKKVQKRLRKHTDKYLPQDRKKKSNV